MWKNINSQTFLQLLLSVFTLCFQSWCWEYLHKAAVGGESPKSSLTKEKTQAKVLLFSKTPFSPLEKQTPSAFCFMFNLYHAVSKKKSI